MKILENLKVISVKKNLKISAAIKKISQHESGVLLVVNKKKLQGYLQEGDIKKALLKKNINLNDKIEKIINKNPFTIRNNLSLDQKILKLKNSARLRAPIINDNHQIVGLMYFPNFEKIFDGQKFSFKNPNNKKKILLVGGGGYIGSLLTRLLLKSKYYVIVYDQFKFGLESLKEIRKNKNLKIIKGDVSDLNKMLNISFGIDAIVDLSGIVGDPASEINPTKTIVENYFNSRNLAEVAKIFKIERYIYISSCSVYGFAKGQKKINEKSKTNPLSLYAECKLKSENAILSLSDKNFNPTILRLATVFGYSPRQRFDLVVNIFTLLAAKSGKIKVFGGDQYRPNIHVFDVANAIKICLESKIKKVKNQIFNVGDNKLNLKIIDLAKTISKLNKKSKIIIESHLVDKRDYHVDFTKIKKILKFKTRYNISSGSRELFNKIKNNKFKNIKKINFSNFNVEIKNLYD